MNLYEYNTSFRAFQPIRADLAEKTGLKDLGNDFVFVVYRVDDAIKLRDFEKEALYASVPMPSLDDIYSDEEEEVEGKEQKMSKQQKEDQQLTEIKKTKITIETYQQELDELDDEVVKDKVVVKLIEATEKKEEQVVLEQQENLAADEQRSPTIKEDDKNQNDENNDNENNDNENQDDDEYCLEQEIIDLCKANMITRASIVDRLNHMLNEIWGQRGVYVSTFGSSLHGLGTDNANVDLCIVVPYNSEHTKHEIRILRLLPNSLFNMYCVSNYLNAIGMTNVEPISKATVPICRFTDPITKLNCNINTNDVLGIHSTKLIMQYMKLDVRVRPLLFAIRYLCKKKAIASARNGTMASYAYHLLALYFLIHVQNPPVLPNLQQLTDAECKSKRCHYKRATRPVEGFDVRYHDCVIIDNKETEDFAITYDLDEHSTLWPSTSTKGVGELLVEFLEYFSNRDNLFKTMSISSPLDKIEMQKAWEHHLIVFPDPFFKTRNVCATVTKIGGDIICKEFKQASDMLKSGKTLQQVLNHKDAVPRPVDPQSLNFKLSKQRRQMCILAK
ncbi:Terminal uridylyltransferase 7 [Choanephora cucurbitarum]|uniref:Terminal uridylyltransferase 7 n=1 Tax=Choanephora cucurbitarum TaxID=101091 RepID=A0A1C7N932_9FUNG|nr:Terminal uridylyltransferase 7 [Choanephora cucurbitarum]